MGDSVWVIALFVAGTVTLLSGVAAAGGRRRWNRSADRSVGTRGAFARALDAELERARRHEHPLAVILVAAPRTGTDATAVVAGALADLPIRRIDHVGVLGRDVYLIAPETGPRAMRSLCERIAAGVRTDVELRAVCFPEDGLSAGTLLAGLTADPTPRRTRVRRLGRVPPQASA